ncbi:OsmC family protein [Arthrobacter sp. 2MCAF14]|uniref:OsmC family protein n=1 Tax=Arthrobacter sp. 2MCAF14 TaxID=3232982 RepID=UPI003F93A671
MTKTHNYAIDLAWTGNLGEGTANPRAYSRNHDVTVEGVGTISGSSDPSFRGDPTRWNPEQLLVASIAQCHMLWYLGLAAAARIVVTDYQDHPTGTMLEKTNGAGQFSEVILRPEVTIASPRDEDRARELHERVAEFCFIARSINFPIHHEVTIRTT